MVHSAEEALALAERELARTERLVKAGALAERDSRTARNLPQPSRAARRCAGARRVGAEVARQRDRASADSRVWWPEKGERGRGQPWHRALHIIDPSSMRLEASVPSEQLADVHVGAPVTSPSAAIPGSSSRASRADQPDGRSGDAAGADLRHDPQHRRPALSRVCSPKAA